MDNKAQDIFDTLQADKAKAAQMRADRKEKLMDNSEYARLVDEISEKTEARDHITLDWNGKHPSFVESLEKLKEQIKEGELALAALFLRNAQANKETVIYKVGKNGKKKRVGVEFRVKIIKQQALF